MGEGGEDSNNPNDSPKSSPAGTKPRRNSSTSTASNASYDVPSTHPDEGKRKPTATLLGQMPKASSRIAKKPRAKPSITTNAETSEITFISPTLFTWVVSAGVVILVSAISFSAGYAMGREVGRGEASGFLGYGDMGGDGEDIVKGGLKRLRWGTTGGRVVV